MKAWALTIFHAKPGGTNFSVARGLYIDHCTILGQLHFFGKQRALTPLVGIDIAVVAVNFELKGATFLSVERKLFFDEAPVSAVLRSATYGKEPRDFGSPFLCPFVYIPVNSCIFVGIGKVLMINSGLFAVEAVRLDCGAAVESARGAQSDGEVVEHIAFHAAAGAGQTHGPSPPTPFDLHIGPIPA